MSDLAMEARAAVLGLYATKVFSVVPEDFQKVEPHADFILSLLQAF